MSVLCGWERERERGSVECVCVSVRVVCACVARAYVVCDVCCESACVV